MCVLTVINGMRVLTVINGIGIDIEMVSKLSTSQFRYKVTKLILYDNYKRQKISKDFHFGKLFSHIKFPLL